MKFLWFIPLSLSFALAGCSITIEQGSGQEKEEAKEEEKEVKAEDKQNESKEENKDESKEVQDENKNEPKDEQDGNKEEIKKEDNEGTPLQATEDLSRKEIQDILLEFINEDVGRISAQEEIVFASLDSVTGGNYTTDAALYEELTTTAIPEYEKALQMMFGLEPKWEGLEEPTVLMVKAGELFLEALMLEKEAYDRQDPSFREQSYAVMDEYLQTIDEYHQKLEKLSEAYGIVYTRKPF